MREHEGVIRKKGPLRVMNWVRLNPRHVYGLGTRFLGSNI